MPALFKSSTPASSCPSSGSAYGAGIMGQFDSDNPVRPAEYHADKNLDLRGYALTSAVKNLVDYGSDDLTQPPQFATLFGPARVPAFSNVYKVYDWVWGTSPDPGHRGSLLSTYAVTALGLATTPGEQLHAPQHGYNLGDDFGVGGAMLIYADADTVALHYTRHDTAAEGYTVHVDNLCTDPGLLALYRSLDGGARYTYAPGSAYNLPGLRQGQVFGTARGSEIVVAIVDSGTFMDPRSRCEWWQVGGC